MRVLIPVVVVVSSLLSASGQSIPVSSSARTDETARVNPLSSFSAEWKKPDYLSCNTAADAAYMSRDEQAIIWILNMLRKNPGLFLRSVVLNPKSRYYVQSGETNFYKKTLVTDLRKLKPASTVLLPDETLFESARCHAETSGKKGYVGHTRFPECTAAFSGECISYGSSDPLAVVMQLLFDEDVESLGHRKILTDFSYTRLAAAGRPHAEYGHNVVLDLE